ncbi:hypothetical protein L593_14290 [Salinarchaeum sp. Harcht-Bsk1]|nr:hypothetical protein L593_14290 [Salinarchaeum sp. Harcht-Bsk1]
MEGIDVSGTDRGAERRRLLAAVRDDAESDAESDERSSAQTGPSPTTDGGVVTLSAPLYHCTACDRTYLEEPITCLGCGERSFERRTTE